MEFELKAYLERIGLELNGSETETEKLKKMHLHHITHIPFEALNPYMDIPVGVDPASTFEKMVVNKRGGYCFEQNSLFCTALNAAGIKAYGVHARVGATGDFGLPLHRMNIVEADGVRYIADVGFGGDCFVLPLELKLEVEQSDGRNTYRIIKNPTPECDYAVQILKDGKFANLLGTSKQVIARYEKGENTPKITTVSHYAKVLGVSLQYLINEDCTDRNATLTDKTTTPEEQELSEGEKMLLDLFRQVPDSQQQLVLQMISVALKTKE